MKKLLLTTLLALLTPTIVQADTKITEEEIYNEVKVAITTVSVVYDVNQVYLAFNGSKATSIEELISAKFLEEPDKIPAGVSVSLNAKDGSVTYAGLSDGACSKIKTCENGKFTYNG